MVDLKALEKAVGELEEARVMTILDNFVASSPSEEEGQKVIEACRQGMTKVGDLFETGEYFLGDLVFAGELLTVAVDKLKPVIGGGGSSSVGTMVLGTVKGDIHDIGKNIFKNLAEAGGFKVYDLGIDTPVSLFVEKVKEYKPDVVGLSGVLSMALEMMKETIQALEKAGLRNQVKIIIGGIPVSREACQDMKADAFSHNAAEGVKICREWVM
jgi:dimethylamine corrinoid protein